MENTMNRLYFFGAILILFLVFALPVTAETYDGITPAEETVCDQLKEDGITKGLYGLCVAFCEAQDILDVSTPITPEELESLKIDSPSSVILANYNKKKKDGDPDMPCVLVDEPCPCFTKQELEDIDGYDSNGMYMDSFDYWTWSIGYYRLGFMEEKNQSIDNDNIEIFMFTTAHSGAYCSYVNNQTSPPTSRVLYSKNNEEFTADNWEACYSQLEQAISTH